MSEKEIFFDKDSNIYYFECPQCDMMCEVPMSEIRCTIFRHGNFKKDMAFVPPHAPKSQCDLWIKKDLIWGCGKPFKFDGQTVVKCEYI